MSSTKLLSLQCVVFTQSDKHWLLVLCFANWLIDVQGDKSGMTTNWNNGWNEHFDLESWKTKWKKDFISKQNGTNKQTKTRWCIQIGELRSSFRKTIGQFDRNQYIDANSRLKASCWPYSCQDGQLGRSYNWNQECIFYSPRYLSVEGGR